MLSAFKGDLFLGDFFRSLAVVVRTSRLPWRMTRIGVVCELCRVDDGESTVRAGATQRYNFTLVPF